MLASTISAPRTVWAVPRRVSKVVDLPRDEESSDDDPNLLGILLLEGVTSSWKVVASFAKQGGTNCAEARLTEWSGKLLFL
jgi:hypothetical protein